MKVKYFLLTFVLLMTGSIVFAMSPRIESFAIYNYSSKNIVIKADFLENPDKEEHRSWNQSIDDINLVMNVSLFNANEIRLAPYQNRTIIHYYPFDSRYGTSYAFELLDQIPFMKKMRAIFKTLEIVCEATLHTERRVITLDNLEDQIVKKMVLGGGTAYYILEIFDYDFEGKRASEW